MKIYLTVTQEYNITKNKNTQKYGENKTITVTTNSGDRLYTALDIAKHYHQRYIYWATYNKVLKCSYKIGKLLIFSRKDILNAQKKNHFKRFFI